MQILFPFGYEQLEILKIFFTILCSFFLLKKLRIIKVMCFAHCHQ